MAGFLFSYRILIKLKKFILRNYFIPKALLFLHQFSFIDFLTNICGDQVVLKLQVLNQEKKSPIRTTVKLPISNLNPNLRNSLN